MLFLNILYYSIPLEPKAFFIPPEIKKIMTPVSGVIHLGLPIGTPADSK